MRSLAPAFVRAPRRPSAPFDIDDILFRDRYRAPVRNGGRGIDRFLKWRGDNVATHSPDRPDAVWPIRNAIRRAYSFPFHKHGVSSGRPPPSFPPSPVSRRRSGHRPVPRPETTEYFSRSRGRHAHCLHRLCSFRRVVVVVILRGRGHRGRWNERVYRYRSVSRWIKMPPKE